MGDHRTTARQRHCASDATIMTSMRSIPPQMTGSERVKARRSQGIAAAGLPYTLKPTASNTAGKPMWGTWGMPDEYVYGPTSKSTYGGIGGAASKFPNCTGSPHDTP